MTRIPLIEPFPLPAGADLPTNLVSWQPDPARTVLLIHDMQRYFLRPFPQGTEPRTTLVRNIASLRGQCAALRIPVAYTAQPGSMTTTQRGLLMDFWGPGMRSADADRQVEEPLTPAPEDWFFTKWRYSAFFRSDLLERMRSSGRDQILLCGIYAHVGILATAVEALAHDIQTFVVADATADFSKFYHQMALTYVAERCGMVVTTAAVVRRLAAAGADAREGTGA